MTGSWISIAIEVVVAVLLSITIGYCVLLNTRLKRLRADETQLRATIGELVRVTEVAERAIGDLREAATECDRTLAKRVREAEYFSVEIAREIGEGSQVLERIMQITRTARATAAAEPAPTSGGAALPEAQAPDVAPPSAADAAAARPRMSELKAKFAQSAERLASLRRDMDGRAA